MSPAHEPATHPPPGIAGLRPEWSRLVPVEDATGEVRTWHVLDTHADRPDDLASTDVRVTLLCVHGNPTWSYAFRALLASAPPDVRVVAIDHLDMGFSERTGTVRRLATRIDDLGRLTDALGLSGAVVTVAHDWGGPISLGWAQRHRADLAGVVLMNTAVHQPAGSPAPALIRLVRSPGILPATTATTTAFLRGAFEVSGGRPSAPVRNGFLAPYRRADRRRAITGFVEDIPLDPAHPSADTLDAVADGLADLAQVPALLLWGARDPIFSDRYLHDLERRLPHADVHRYPTAGHLVGEGTDAFAAVLDWVADRFGRRPPGEVEHPRPSTDAAVSDGASTRLLDGLAEATPTALAVAEMDTGATIDVEALRALVDRTAAGLVASGVRPGDRVALMIPPGIELAATLLACWRARAVAVLVDAGLGPRGMGAAMASADPDHLVGITRAMAAARALRWPGRRISTTGLGPLARRALGVDTDLPSIRSSGGGRVDLPTLPAADEVAAIVFTSGSTGPSKGVVYDHAALSAQRDAIGALYGIGRDDRLVAAFAPFALFGPMLGITSVVPDMDVTEPSTLTAAALGDATARIGATLVFASPAALANVVATADALTPAHREAFAGVRLLLSAGAPVSASLLRSAAALFPAATACTPYGMTECLPVASISLSEIDAAGTGDGVCVGRPVPGVDVVIRPVDASGMATGDGTDEPGVLGEVVVRAAHARMGYDRLWHTQHRADRPPGWHSTGDVGSLDEAGRLWIGGRLGHVVTTPDGPVAPVRHEHAVESVLGVQRSAVVGVGPVGVQELVVVVEAPGPARLADLATTDRVRAVVPATAVLQVPQLPVDRRHHSKVDRTEVAAWAAGVLAGGRVRAL